VTGGAGFVGTATTRHFLRTTDSRVLSYDKLSYAADLDALEELQIYEKYQFIEADICSRDSLQKSLDSFQPDAVIHTAAETHVDRSIQDSTEFVRTNLVGTFTLLEAVRHYWSQLPASQRKTFRLLHVSTDEVYGSLGHQGRFTEATPYRPHSPYSATKAGSDHLVMAWYHTYQLPVLLTHCSNNYGPSQFAEKLIPLVILNALAEKSLPIYGDGENVRDWLYVDDHAKALSLVLCAGETGQTYNVGGSNERTNLQVVEAICQLLEELCPRPSGKYRDLIKFVADRPGHDWRYAIDASKISSDLGWRAEESFETGLRKTVEWYLAKSQGPHGAAEKD